MGAEKDQGAALRLVEELSMLLSRTRKVLGAHAARALEGHGEATQTWSVLACIARGYATTQREIAEQIAHDPAAVSRALDELEKQRMVKRQRDPDDRRRVLVEVTAAGRKRFEAVQADVLSAVDHALRGLNTPDRLQLRALLHRLLEVERDPNCTLRGGGSRRSG